MNMVPLIFLVLFSLQKKTIFHDTLQTSPYFGCLKLTQLLSSICENLHIFFSRKRMQTSKDSKTT